MGSSPPRRTSKLAGALDSQNSLQDVALSCIRASSEVVSYQSRRFEVTTLSDGVAAHKVCAQAEGKSNSHSNLRELQEVF